MEVCDLYESLSSLDEHHVDERHIRLKQENAALQQRIHLLEEALQSTEERWQDRYDEERTRHKERINHLEKERDLQIETLTLKLQLLEKEHSESASQKEKLQHEVNTLKEQCGAKEERLSLLEQELREAVKDQEDASGQLKVTRSNAEEDIKRRDILIEDLQEQVESLKPIVANRCCSNSVLQYSTELQEEVSHLRTEQRQLKEANDELHAQLMQRSIAEGQSLLNGMIGTRSLAQEICDMSKEELMKTLSEQEAVNKKLRDYIDGILLRIMEMYPAILEVRK